MIDVPDNQRLERPTVMCVDDEPQVLAGLGLNLRRAYNFVGLNTPAEAVERLPRLQPAVIVSDMRMPGMNGAELLARARTLAPNTIRVLLTGHAELEAAVRAVNEGQIFRFLMKPCPSPAFLSAVQAAVEQHRLVTAEKVLLEQTVKGSITALLEALAMVSPAAFGRGRRIKTLVRAMGPHVELTDTWVVELAAELSQVGYVSVPQDVVEKIYRRAELSEPERALVLKVPSVTHQLLSHIPRLEPVWGVLKEQSPGKPASSLPGKLLAIALAFDDLSLSGSTPEEAIRELATSGQHDANVRDALTAVQGAASRMTVHELPLDKLLAGQVLAADVHSKSGALLLVKGTKISGPVIDRLRNISHGIGVQQPLRVWDRDVV